MSNFAGTQRIAGIKGVIPHSRINALESCYSEREASAVRHNHRFFGSRQRPRGWGRRGVGKPEAAPRLVG
jgi:hypothetical protein